MADHIWTVLCESSSIDSQTNVVSLFKCLERVELQAAGSDEPSIESLSSLSLSMELVSLWQRTAIDSREPDLPVRIKLKTPGGKRPPSYEVLVKFQDHVRSRHVLRIAALPFDGPGIYLFQIQQQNTSTRKWKTVAKIPLEVVIKSANSQDAIH